ncbi:MAG: alpha/beta fold hydrolase, partial [Bdellovibrionaceae bacterium]|nr:alpha/beta fold hydrolase [Pseudobdellovibrionaceae bacterium]
MQSVQNHQFEYVLHRGTGPAVIFENGLGATFDWWAKVFPEIAKTQTTFAYNRAGYGRSQAKSDSIPDVELAIEDLRSLLHELNVKPPYILVGHSLGGLYFQYYARKYPDEVKGLLLVDSTHPDQMSGDGAVDKWPWWVKTVVYTLTPKAGMQELQQVEATGQKVKALPALNTDKIKSVVLVADEPKNPSTPLEINAV